MVLAAVPAYAQTYIGNQIVAQREISIVRKLCRDMETYYDASSGSTTKYSRQFRPDMADSLLTQLRLDEITLQECKVAGFIQ